MHQIMKIHIPMLIKIFKIIRKVGELKIFKLLKANHYLISRIRKIIKKRKAKVRI
jgi:hypothetical protein